MVNISDCGNKQIFNEQGLTLIEIVASLIILGITAVTFSTLITGSMSSLLSSGNRSITLYQAQQYLDNNFSNGEIETEEVEVFPATLTISFGDEPDETINVSGQLVKVEVDYQFNRRTGNISITSFK